MRLPRRARLRGQALVEFALILPFLAFFLMAIIELGRAWNIKQVVTDASREGARVGVIFDPTVTIDTVIGRAKNKAWRAGLDTSQVTVQLLDSNLQVCSPQSNCFHKGTGQITTVRVDYACSKTVGGKCFPILNRVMSVLASFLARNGGVGPMTPLANTTLSGTTSMRNE